MPIEMLRHTTLPHRVLTNAWCTWQTNMNFFGSGCMYIGSPCKRCNVYFTHPYLQVDGFLPQFSFQLHFLNPLTLLASAQWNTSSIQLFLCGNFQKNRFVGRFHWLQTTLSKMQMCTIQLIVSYEVYLWGIIQQFICVKDSTRRPNKIPKIIQEKNFKVNNSQRRQQIIRRSILVKYFWRGASAG